MSSLIPYKNRYVFSGCITDALWAVGSNEDFEVESQIAFMKSVGLSPRDKFLDFGCGCLRGSAKILDYVDDSNFYGVDISEGLISVIPKRLELLGIKKTPRIYLLNDYRLDDLLPEKFDFILSVSIFTHLMSDIVPDVFRGIASVLKPKGVYYFTLYPTEKEIHEGDIEYARFNKNWLIDIGSKCGLKVEDIDGDFKNPSPISNYIERVNTPHLAQWVMRASLL